MNPGVKNLAAWLWLLALTLGATVNVSSSAPAAMQSLTCGVIDGERAEVPGVVRISNLKRVLVRAALQPGEQPVEDLRLTGPKAPGQPDSGNLEILVTRRGDASLSRMETKTAVVGHGSEPGLQYLDITLEIPIPAAVRRKNIEQYLAWLEHESVKTGKGSQFKRLTQDRAVAVATFERMYMEHIAGVFDVTCVYAPRRAGALTARIESSPPVRLEILFESSFFDQPAFR
jgi:hypothetical protein